MTPEIMEVTFGAQVFSFTVERRDRKTLSINVHPDQAVVVLAPKDACTETIIAKVQKRARWISEQRRYFAQFQPRALARRYIAGETHMYLGRQYKLKVLADTQNKVKMQRGQMTVYSTNSDCEEWTRDLLRDWLYQRAKAKFAERLSICQDRFPNSGQMQPNSLIIRDMSHRWGSMTARNNLVLNRNLIGASVDCIDYVVTHELCHIDQPNHGKDFFNLLQRVMPDWEKRKIKLERQMA